MDVLKGKVYDFMVYLGIREKGILEEYNLENKGVDSDF